MLDTNPIQQKDSEVKTGNLRILLWDIDGTLMRSTKQGAFREYFAPVMKRVFGSEGNLDNIKVSGMTDTQIFYEALKDEGVTPEQIIGAKERLLPIFKEEMSKLVGKNSNSYELFPGVREILAATDKDSDFHNCLLTGNLSVAAEIKLSYFDLWKYFKNSPNFFGEISHDRRELGKQAVKTISEFSGITLSAEQFIVIGDTPNDISAARAFGAKMLSVATGRSHPKEELLKFKPDYLLENLADTAEVLKVLKSL